ncbi:TIGR03564 family F420-dependent LLM class oxidoreductase [Nocardia bovistercoris]|uniref:TIGR03564 family F420-dependent LLM class oxidoreductase n=1 Tax=Nocardia bovistercoris TaxID=2785916 RepID=A0A931IB98_9NOCA|nr:TIGR03564 family F420-dependent LLM class oxidoreductase [Nocardia bovistercoris]MBH0776695.1 TIGR03564 family F420-dependent LLM class oxidoreductase [Nocardia bovistercoris]
MRIGVMIGPERGDTARKVARMLDDVEWAESAGLDTAWIPQVPTDFDALMTIALMGTRTSRIELGTAVVPLHAQHPITLARQALSAHAATAGRLTLGVGPSHHLIVHDMLGLSYDKPAAYTRDCLDVLNPALHGARQVDIHNSTFTVHHPLDLTPVAPVSVMVSALAPTMLRLAGEQADGTILWMADERAISEHIAPRITEAARDAGRRTPRIVAGLPVCLCRPSEVDEAKARTNRILGRDENFPNYRRLLRHGNSDTIGDMCLAGDEEAIAAGLRRYADAGATDISVRLLPIGDDRDSLITSKHRTRQMIADIADELHGEPTS